MNEKVTVHVFFRPQEYEEMLKLAEQLKIRSIAALIKIALDNYMTRYNSR